MQEDSDLDRDPEAVALRDKLERACAGDADAAGELLVEHVSEVESFIRFNLPRSLATRESVSDLTQSVVSDLLPEFEGTDFPSPEAFKGWLRRCALNKIRMRLRHWRAQQRDPDRARPMHDIEVQPFAASQTSPSQAAHRVEVGAALHDALQELSVDQREVVVLVKLMGLSHLEAGRAIGKSTESSRQLLARGLRRLSEILPDASATWSGE